MKLDKLARREVRGKPPTTLNEYPKYFAVKRQQREAMWQEGRGTSLFRVYSKTTRGLSKCLCLARARQKHEWPSDDCGALLYTVYGGTELGATYEARSVARKAVRFARRAADGREESNMIEHEGNSLFCFAARELLNRDHLSLDTRRN